jgi:diadenosine tetraphosphate (Ap4A) HIT family hydrolase
MTEQQQSAATPDTTMSPYLVVAQQPQQAQQPPGGGPGAPPGGGEQPWRWAAPPPPRGGGGGREPRERAPKRPRTEDAGPANTEATVYVRNLSYGASDDAIRAFFAPAGEVVEVRLGVGADGRPRGFAHVEFRAKEQAEAALGMSGQKLMDRELKSAPRCTALRCVRVCVLLACSLLACLRVLRSRAVLSARACCVSPFSVLFLFLPPPPPVAVEAATERTERPPRPAGPRVAPPGEAAPGCWFCLSNAKDTHLLASIAAETYIALDKGALTPLHVLLIPVEHYPSTAMLPPSAAEEQWRYAAALRRCFAEACGGAALVCFERHLALRGKGGNHAHVNAVPLPAAAAAGARAAFEAAAQRAGFAFLGLPPAPAAPEAAAQLAAAVGGAEYFCVTLPDGARLVHPLAQGERFNMQFGREARTAAQSAHIHMAAFPAMRCVFCADSNLSFLAPAFCFRVR